MAGSMAFATDAMFLPFSPFHDLPPSQGGYSFAPTMCSSTARLECSAAGPEHPAGGPGYAAAGPGYTSAGPEYTDAGPGYTAGQQQAWPDMRGLYGLEDPHLPSLTPWGAGAEFPFTSNDGMPAASFHEHQDPTEVLGQRHLTASRQRCGVQMLRCGAPAVEDLTNGGQHFTPEMLRELVLLSQGAPMDSLPPKGGGYAQRQQQLAQQPPLSASNRRAEETHRMETLLAASNSSVDNRGQLLHHDSRRDSIITVERSFRGVHEPCTPQGERHAASSGGNSARGLTLPAAGITVDPSFRGLHEPVCLTGIPHGERLAASPPGRNSGGGNNSSGGNSARGLTLPTAGISVRNQLQELAQEDARGSGCVRYITSPGTPPRVSLAHRSPGIAVTKLGGGPGLAVDRPTSDRGSLLDEGLLLPASKQHNDLYPGEQPGALHVSDCGAMHDWAWDPEADRGMEQRLGQKTALSADAAQRHETPRGVPGGGPRTHHSQDSRDPRVKRKWEAVEGEEGQEGGEGGKVQKGNNLSRKHVREKRRRERISVAMERLRSTVQSHGDMATIVNDATTVIKQQNALIADLQRKAVLAEMMGSRSF